MAEEIGNDTKTERGFIVMGITILPTPSLIQVLLNGNVSGGTDLIISAGDALLVTDHMSVGAATAPATDTSIDLKATDAALLLNRLTTVRRDALTPTFGMILFNTNTDRLEIFNGTTWNSLDRPIFAQLSSSVNQEPGDLNPTTITFNTQDNIQGITHSTTVNPGEITIDVEGVYFISPQAQVGKTSGGTKKDFDLFIQIDRGSGFVNEPNSNIKLTIKDSDITDVVVLALAISLNVGDKITMMQRVSDAGVGLGLKNTDPEVGPPAIPRTPSIIFTMHRIGGL